MVETIDNIFTLGKLPNIMLIFGQEEYLIEEAFKQVLAKLRMENSINFDFDILDGEETGVNSLVDLCNSLPMISQHRVVAVKNFEKMFTARQSKKEDKYRSLTKYLANPSPTTFLLLASEAEISGGIGNLYKSDRKKAFQKISNLKYPYDIILNKYEWIELPKVYDSKYPNWVEGRLSRHGKSIDSEALALLIANSRQTLRDLSNEIEKLLAFVQDKEKIEIDDISFLVGNTRQYNVFELQKAVGQRLLAKSLSIMENMMDTDRQEMLVITMLTRYFILLAKLHEESKKGMNRYELAAKVGVSPFFLSEYLDALSHYQPDAINKALLALCQADLDIKTTTTPSKLILQRTLINIVDKEFKINS